MGIFLAVLREQAEDEMKSAQEKLVTGATVTLELGIDIGSLDQVVQVGTPQRFQVLRSDWAAAAGVARFHRFCSLSWTMCTLLRRISWGRSIGAFCA